MRYPAGDTRQQQKNIPAHASAHAKEIKNKKDADGEHGALELHGAVGPGEPLLLGRQRLDRILELLFLATFRGMPTANAEAEYGSECSIGKVSGESCLGSPSDRPKDLGGRPFACSEMSFTVRLIAVAPGQQLLLQRPSRGHIHVHWPAADSRHDLPQQSLDQRLVRRRHVDCAGMGAPVLKMTASERRSF